VTGATIIFGAMPSVPPALLCVVNYPANTGYAWDFIEGLYAALADRLADRGVRTLVAYPSIDAPPRALAGSAAEPVVLDASLATPASRQEMATLVRRERVTTVYYTDRPAWSMAYRGLRRAGVERIVVHDHTSGERTTPSALRAAVKRLTLSLPGVSADLVIAVSDYVARRQVEVGCMPPERVVRVWNGITVPPPTDRSDRTAHRLLGLDPARPLVAAGGRVASEKGFVHLLRAFDQLSARLPEAALLLVGDGPALSALRELRDALHSAPNVFLTGYRRDAADLIGAADVAVVPSVWQDALPLAVIEPMARGIPVIGSRVGGIPEMIEDGVTGVLVPPGDESALAAVIADLLADRPRALAYGAAGRRRVTEHFARQRQLSTLETLVWDPATRQ
jgi:glycosyltransferase involved in cell wall biosynthesis